MKPFITLTIISALLLNGCSEKLSFSGVTFLTLKGVITDTTDKPVPNLPITLNAAIDQWYKYAIQSGPVKVSSTVTQGDGSFQFTFPVSNGYLYVLLPSPYKIADSTNVVVTTLSDTINYYKARVDFASFSNYIYDMDTIKVVSQ